MDSHVQLVGILNVTNDSFSDGGLYLDPRVALARAGQLFDEGADLIDVGAESTNPKSSPLTPYEEWHRLERLMPELLDRYPGKISLDTYHFETAEEAATTGPIILNDVTGFFDPQMIRLAAEFDLTCILSHLPSSAEGDIQAAHTGTPVDSFNQVVDELLERRDEMAAAGVLPENIILDPGIGFGKTMLLNWQLLEFAKSAEGHRVMIGHSRKRFLGYNPNTGRQLPNADEIRLSDERNLQAAKIAIEAGAAYLRVHEPALYVDLLN